MKGGACFPAWSPDGQRIAFNGDPNNLQPANRFGPTQIFVMDADGSHITPIAEGAGVARWSPDGTQLLFCRQILRHSGPHQGTPNNSLSVWIASVDGSRLMRVPGLVLQESGVAWLNNGNAIAFTSRDDKGRRVIKSVRPDGTGSILLVDSKGVDLFNPTLSPDGSELFAEANPIITAFNRNAYNEPSIVLFDLKKKTSILIAQGLNPSILWQPQAQ
jgi:Tol biopolymer transport system component